MHRKQSLSLRIILSFVLQIIIAPLPFAWGLLGQQSSPLIEQGWGLFKAGKRDQAIVVFRHGIEQEPDNVWLHRAYQTAMIDAGRYEEMQRYYRDQLAQHKGLALWYYLLAFWDDDVTEVKKLVHEGLALEPANPWLVWYDGYLKAQDLANRGRWDEALRTLDAVPTPRQDPVYYHIFRSSILLLEGKYDETMEEANAAVEEDPFDSQGYSMRGSAYYRKNQPEKSIATLRELEQLGNFAQVHSGLGGELWEQGKISEAKAEFSKAIHSPRDSNAWACALASSYSSLNDVKNAEYYARLGIRLYPEDTCSKAIIVGLQSADGNLDAAEKSAKEILDQNPNDENGLMAMGDLSLWRQRYTDAAKFYSKGLEHVPNNARFLLGRGTALNGDCKCKEGLTYLEQAHKNFPNSTDVNRALGQYHLSQGSYQVANTYFARAIAIQSDDYLSYESIGYADTQMGYNEEALAAYRLSRRYAPTAKEKNRLDGAVKSVEYALKTQTNSFPKDDQASPIIFKEVKTMDIPRPITFTIANTHDMVHYIGRPWTGMTPTKRFEEKILYMNLPQWSPDANSIYFAGQDLTALDVVSGQVRVIVKNSVDISHIGLAGSQLNKSKHLTSLSFGRARISTDGKFIYAMESKYYDHKILDQIVMASVDGKERKVVFPYKQKPRGFEYIPVLDCLIVWKSDGLWRVDPHTMASNLISHEAPVFWNASVSPDGKTLLYGTISGYRDGELQRLNLDTGEKTPLGIRGRNPVWSPDGTNIAFIYGDKELRILDPKTGELHNVQGPFERNIEDPNSASYMSRGLVWAPDSRYVLYTLGFMRDRVTKKSLPMITVLSDLKERQIWYSTTTYENVAWAPDTWKTK